MPNWWDQIKSGAMAGLQTAGDVVGGARYLLAPTQSEAMGDEEQRPGEFRSGNVVEAMRPSAGRFAMNVADSAGRFLKGTAEGAGMLGYAALKGGPTGAGLATDPQFQKIAYAVGKDPKAIAQGVKDYAVNRYGSGDALLDTLYTDPVGAASDASAVLTLGGGAAAKAPGTIGKVGRALATAGELADPLAGLSRAAQAERPMARALEAVDELTPLAARRRPGPAEGQFGLPFDQEPIPDIVPEKPPVAAAPPPPPAAPPPAPPAADSTGMDTFDELIGRGVDRSEEGLQELGIRTTAPLDDPAGASGGARNFKHHAMDRRIGGVTRMNVSGSREQNIARRQKYVDANLQKAKKFYGEDSPIYGAHKALAESHPRTYAHLDVGKAPGKGLAMFSPNPTPGVKVGTVEMNADKVAKGAKAYGHVPELEALQHIYHEGTHGAQAKGMGVFRSNELYNQFAKSPKADQRFGYWEAPPEVTARAGQYFHPGWNELQAAAEAGQPTLPGTRALAQDFALNESELYGGLAQDTKDIWAKQNRKYGKYQERGNRFGRKGTFENLKGEQRGFDFGDDPGAALANLDLTEIDAADALAGLFRSLEGR